MQTSFAEAHAATGVTISPPLEVSPLDLRSYRAITLSNQLKVLVVSDPLSDKAAAAMDVAVGHFSDPPHIPGLAHFLEHMLFLGTEKYPDEGSYNKFLAENGGHSNAYTAAENTNFHFDVVVPKNNATQPALPRFKEALDRFAQFFTAPLFTESATERELNAVHSEHQKNLQADSRRMYQLKKVMANPKHPYCKFGTGSKETLYDTPKEAGVDTRAALLHFYETYYSANLMALCVIGPYDLDQLQLWVTELFSHIPNHNAPHPSEEYRDIAPLLPEHRGLIYHMDTIKDIRHLDLTWVTPPFVQYYRSKPGRYVGDLLGDEGNGSIISLLKAKGWADTLTAGVIDHHTFTMVQVTITLTKEGVSQVDNIVDMVYKYIEMVKQKGIQEWLYKEEAAIAESLFRFRERGSAIGHVTGMASCMHYYPPTEYLSGQYLYKEFDAKKILELLEHLTPENGNVTVAGKFAAEKADKKERWYETPYHVEKIAEEKLKVWEMGGTTEDLHIPESNPFIPSDFELLAEPYPEDHEDKEGPKVILSNEYMDVYHKLDRTFRRPKATIVLQMRTPLTYQSPYHAVMANLFTYLLEDALSEYSYAAERAGFAYSLHQATSGIRLHVEGYSHRIDVLVSAVVKKMTTFVAEERRFEMIRDALERDYLNFDTNQPYVHCMYNLTYLLEQPRWHVQDYVKVFRDGEVSLENLTRYSKEVQSRMHMTALVSGNISESMAIGMCQNVQEMIGYKALPDVEQLDRRVVQVEVGRDVYTRREHPNGEDNNSAIAVLYVVGPKGDFETDVKIELMGEMLQKPAFHELRTVQQLGYIVFGGHHSIDYVRAIHVIVQSTVANPDELLERIDAFMGKFRQETLEAMSEDKFQDYVAALRTSKAAPEKKLSSRSSRFWVEIERNYRRFDRADREIEALEGICMADMVRFFDEVMADGGERRRRVVSQVFCKQHAFAERRAVPQGAVDVQDPVAFRRRNALYAVAGVREAVQL